MSRHRFTERHAAAFVVIILVIGLILFAWLLREDRRREDRIMVQNMEVSRG